MWGLDDIVELLECDETLTAIRQGRAVDADITYQDGLPVASAPARKFEIICTVQPMGGRDLLLMPEAFRTKDMLSLWQAHRTAEQDYVRLDVTDVILFRGKAYQVQSAEDWESYTKVTLCGIDVGSFAGTLDPTNLPTLYPDAAPLSEPTPDPTFDPHSAENLFMDVGPMTLNTYFQSGELHDCRIPGDYSQNPFLYMLPKPGKVTGYTMTGRANSVPFGAYLVTRNALTGGGTDAVFINPENQLNYNQDAGLQVVFDTPVPLAQHDLVQLKVKIKDGESSQVDVMCFLQITFDVA